MKGNSAYPCEYKPGEWRDDVSAPEAKCLCCEGEGRHVYFEFDTRTKEIGRKVKMDCSSCEGLGYYVWG